MLPQVCVIFGSVHYLKSEAHVNEILKFSSHLTEHTASLDFFQRVS
jgi:hypothetical protein